MKTIKTAAYANSASTKSTPNQPDEEVVANHDAHPVAVPPGDTSPEQDHVQEKRLNRFRATWYGQAKRPSSGRNVIP